MGHSFEFRIISQIMAEMRGTQSRQQLLFTDNESVSCFIELARRDRFSIVCISGQNLFCFRLKSLTQSFLHQRCCDGLIQSLARISFSVYLFDADANSAFSHKMQVYWQCFGTDETDKFVSLENLHSQLVLFSLARCTKPQ